MAGEQPPEMSDDDDETVFGESDSTCLWGCCGVISLELVCAWKGETKKGLCNGPAWTPRSRSVRVIHHATAAEMRLSRKGSRTESVRQPCRALPALPVHGSSRITDVELVFIGARYVPV